MGQTALILGGLGLLLVIAGVVTWLFIWGPLAPEEETSETSAEEYPVDEEYYPPDDEEYPPSDDCAPLICKNGGVFNVDTCKCECTEKWKGRRCKECKLTKCSGNGYLDVNKCRCMFPKINRLNKTWSYLHGSEEGTYTRVSGDDVFTECKKNCLTDSTCQAFSVKRTTDNPPYHQCWLNPEGYRLANQGTSGYDTGEVSRPTDSDYPRF